MTDVARSALPPAAATVAALEQRVVDLFIDGVRVLGLPKSLGEIYGLLFISTGPLSLDDLVSRLGISKGSASQGLRALREIGAIREVHHDNGRRTYYEPEIHLKRLAGGFIREQILPHLDSGRAKLDSLGQEIEQLADPATRRFFDERRDRLDYWFRSAKRILPLIQHVLGE